MNDLSRYEAVKAQMKTGDLLQWHSDSALGAAIRIRTHSNVNHSSLVMAFPQSEGVDRRRWTIEALEHGVVLNLLSRRLERHRGEVWWYQLNDEWDLKRSEIERRALGLVGIPYDYKSIACLLFGHVTANDRALFCSETCFLSYGFTGKAPTPADMPGLGIFRRKVRII